MDPERARALLKRVSLCVMASATPDGSPWSTPLFFNYTPDLRFVFESEKDAHHSQLVRANDRVAFVIHDFHSTDPTQTIYVDARAREVPPGSLAEAVETFWHGPHEKTDRTRLTEADYQGDGLLRLYEATPVSFYALVQVDVEGGHKVERRVPLDLP